MNNMEITPLAARPEFDLEGFMLACGDNRLPGEEAALLAGAWERWLPLLGAWSLKGHGGPACIAIRLPESVERKVDALWRASPSRGFRLNSLAQHMCMSALLDFVPQIEALGCAPAPGPAGSMAKALERLGLAAPGSAGSINRRYALLTPYPFRGGCEICHLRPDCSKGQPPSMTLPGRERGGSR